MTALGRIRWLLMVTGHYGFGDHVDDDHAFRYRLDEVWPLWTYSLEEQCKNLRWL